LILNRFHSQRHARSAAAGFFFSCLGEKESGRCAAAWRWDRKHLETAWTKQKTYESSTMAADGD
jgi:hypothetical protein